MGCQADPNNSLVSMLYQFVYYLVRYIMKIKPLNININAYILEYDAQWTPYKHILNKMWWKLNTFVGPMCLIRVTCLRVYNVLRCRQRDPEGQRIHTNLKWIFYICFDMQLAQNRTCSGLTRTNLLKFRIIGASRRKSISDAWIPSQRSSNVQRVAMTVL